jgi:beta-phosphoglucomutase-like phosphatase (HAD superfamily)
LVPRGTPAGTEPTVWLQHVPQDRAGHTSAGTRPKNRTHPDLVPLDGADVDDEVERLLALGATHADVGQTGDEGFVVLRDPDGNEFCVLRRYESADGVDRVTHDVLADSDAFLLDVDGTLMDSNYHHVLAWQRAFHAHGLDLATADVHAWIGMGGDQLVPTVAGEEFEHEHGDDVRAAWREGFDARIEEVLPLVGARALVEALVGTGRPVVLASSAPKPHIDRYLDLLGVRDLVAGWTTADDVETTKPAPDLLSAAAQRVQAKRPVVIGDSPWDCRAAQHADISCVGVGTGGFTTDQLRSSGAAAVYRTLDSLAQASTAVR